MNSKATDLDFILSSLENHLKSKTGVQESPAETGDHDPITKEELLLKIIRQKRLEIAQGRLKSPLGISRFISEWNFGDEIYDLVYEAEKVARSI